jgi:hypothetical protein
VEAEEIREAEGPEEVGCPDSSAHQLGNRFGRVHVSVIYAMHQGRGEFPWPCSCLQADRQRSEGREVEFLQAAAKCETSDDALRM